jgi:hypothetical protein
MGLYERFLDRVDLSLPEGLRRDRSLFIVCRLPSVHLGEPVFGPAIFNAFPSSIREAFGPQIGKGPMVVQDDILRNLPQLRGLPPLERRLGRVDVGGRTAGPLRKVVHRGQNPFLQRWVGSIAEFSVKDLAATGAVDQRLLVDAVAVDGGVELPECFFEDFTRDVIARRVAKSMVHHEVEERL